MDTLPVDLRKNMDKLFLRWVGSWYKHNIKSGEMMLSYLERNAEKIHRCLSSGFGFCCMEAEPISDVVEHFRSLWRRTLKRVNDTLRRLLFEHRRAFLSRSQVCLMSAVAIHCVLLGDVPAYFWKMISEVEVEHYDAKNDWGVLLNQWTQFCRVFCPSEGRIPELAACLKESLEHIVHLIRQGYMKDENEGKFFHNEWKEINDVKVDAASFYFGDAETRAALSDDWKALTKKPHARTLALFLKGEFGELERSLIETQFRLRCFAAYDKDPASHVPVTFLTQKLGSAKVCIGGGMEVHACDKGYTRLFYPSSLQMQEYFVDADVIIAESTYRLCIPLPVFHFFFGNQPGVLGKLKRALVEVDIDKKQIEFLTIHDDEDFQTVTLSSGETVNIPKKWACMKSLFQ